MNKFAAIALFALIAVVSATEEREYSEDEVKTEAGLLLGKEKLFSKYCLESRDAIVDDMHARSRETSSKVFEAFFGATSEIADEVLNVEKRAIEELSAHIQQSTGIDVNDGPMPEDQIQALIEEGKREIESKGALGRMMAATKTAASVLVNAANTALFVRLAHVRSQMNAGLMIRGVFNTCQQVDDYEKQLEARLALAKESLKSENPESELQSFIDAVTVPSLKCYTTKFVSRLNAFCGLFNVATTPFFKMLGVDPKYAQAIEAQRA